MSEIVTSVVALGGLGLLFGSGLAVAAKAFAVPIDEKVEKIREALPGANCGACGFPGCDGLAEAIASGEAPANGCPVGGSDSAEKIASLMGTDSGAAEKIVAKVVCEGTTCNASNKFEYEGIQDCRALSLIGGGNKTCSYGCLGLGSCKVACGFGAIKMEDGIAKIDPEKCTSCGKCVDICPKAIIELVPHSQKVMINCSSNDLGKVVKEACSVGCIGCKICIKTCPFEAIDFDNGLAKINYEKCKNCKLCAKKCPTGAINVLGEEKSR